jgi:hypothetical protein
MCDNKGEPLPASFMQRKPHPNGLLLYLLACAVEHGGRANGFPFIVDFLPHLVVNDTAPDDTIFQFKDRWAQGVVFPDILGDAAFGSIGMLEQLKTSQVNGLFSMASDMEPYLWEVLSAGILINIYYLDFSN